MRFPAGLRAKNGCNFRGRVLRIEQKRNRRLISLAFIRKLPDTPERLEHLKGGAGHLERYALLSPEEMLGAGTVCARMVLQPGCEVGEHTHHGNYEVYYFLSGHGVYRSNGETTTVDAGTVTFTGDGERHALRNDGPEPLEFMAFVLNLPAQA